MPEPVEPDVTERFLEYTSMLEVTISTSIDEGALARNIIHFLATPLLTVVLRCMYVIFLVKREAEKAEETQCVYKRAW